MRKGERREGQEGKEMGREGESGRDREGERWTEKQADRHRQTNIHTYIHTYIFSVLLKESIRLSDNTHYIETSVLQFFVPLIATDQYMLPLLPEVAVSVSSCSKLLVAH